MSLSVTRREYGILPSDHSTVYEYTLSNPNQITVKFITRGCTITSVTTPSRDGTLADIVLGFPTLESWLEYGSNFNTIVGRYANRIEKGEFSINNQQYTLAKNNGNNHLHGGPTGFYSKNWQEKRLIREPDRVGVVLSYVSPDGEEGYPGELTVETSIVLTNNNALILDFKATTNKDTVVNICNHAYWNLSGDYSDDVLSHTLTLNADNCTPINTEMIPTGEIQSVKGTHHDFTKEQVIGSRISVFKDIDSGANGGYDHNYVLNSKSEKKHPDVRAGQIYAATLKDKDTGRRMDVYTSAPGIQVYTGNFLDGRMIGKEGKPYNKHAGVCLETQTFPNSPNQPSFPSPLLKPGELYHHTVTHVFTVEK